MAPHDLEKSTSLKGSRQQKVSVEVPAASSTIIISITTYTSALIKLLKMKFMSIFLQLFPRQTQSETPVMTKNSISPKEAKKEIKMSDFIASPRNPADI